MFDTSAYTTAFLCAYAFLKEFRPTEPFLFEMQIEMSNVTADELNSEVCLRFFV